MALAGVGDKSKEWTESSDKAFHLRRRLTEEEAATVGPVKDIRGTQEAVERLDAVYQFIPDAHEEWAVREAHGKGFEE